LLRNGAIGGFFDLFRAWVSFLRATLLSIETRQEVSKRMNNKPDPADSSLSETMAARIEIKELGDPTHQKKITDAIQALDGVIESKIEKGALHVSYDPLATTEMKIEQVVRSTGSTIKAAATDTEDAHPHLPTPNVQPAPVQNADPASTPDPA